MPLVPGTRFGPYQVENLIGAGAMGEVYRATDPRLGRSVAIKVLPGLFSLDPERLRRFDQEARTAGTLNHPNILSIFDVGTHEGTPYVVTELLEGETLRDRLEASPIPLRKTLEYGAQIARGLAAAQARGVIHRDLKPENLFITHDSNVKILDFGLAKLIQRDDKGPRDTDSLAGTMTGAGTVMGTAGYMAPEQARGEAALPASDIFSLGCVLFEMGTGQRAFHGASPVDTLYALLHNEPPPFPARLRSEAPGFVAIVLRCLEKEPAARFESARDLAFCLTSLSMAGAGEEEAPASRASSLPGAAPGNPVTFKRLTFRRGAIQHARFTPDGHSVAYGGAWEGRPVEPFWMHLGNPEARSIGHPGTDILSVSASGELALCLKQRNRGGFINSGTLARAPMGGGTPRQLLQNVDEADWSPDGSQLAVIREVDSISRLEMPVGNVLFESTGWLSHARVSRDGRHIAFIHHEYNGNDGGTVTLVDLKGNVRPLSEGWGTIRGLAWAADAREVWFTAHLEGAGRNLHAVSLDGALRSMHQVPGQLCMQDVFPDGRAIFTQSLERQAIMVQTPGDAQERDLSWLDWSLMRDISADGQWILILESGEGGGATGTMCIRPTDGSPAVQLGLGSPIQFSPDGAWILALEAVSGSTHQLALLPTGVGEPRKISTGGLQVRSARWLPDGRNLIVAGVEEGRPVRLYRLGVDSGAPQPFGPEGPVSLNFEVSPDGRFVAAHSGDQPILLYPVEGGDPREIPGLKPEDRLQHWNQESGAVLVAKEGEVPMRVTRLDLETGERTLWKELAPPDSTGLSSVRAFRSSADGKVFGYTYTFELDDLYIVNNLK